MRVLLTGVTGQVGAALAPRLRPLGTLIAADRAMLDLTQLESIASALDRIQPEIIINPAAYTAVDKAEDEPQLAMMVNAAAPGIMARWAAEHSASFISFSTDYVFDGTGERPWCEDDPTRPLGAYGASKLAGEHEIRSAGGCSLIVRTSWVYAARGKNFLRTIARLARERSELRVIADQIGAPTSAALIAGAVTHIIEEGPDALRVRSANVNGLVHLCASGAASWHDFATAIVGGMRARRVPLLAERVIPIRTGEYPTRAKRPLNSRLDLSRLKHVFGITPPSWPEALSDELDELAPELALADISEGGGGRGAATPMMST